MAITVENGFVVTSAKAMEGATSDKVFVAYQRGPSNYDLYARIATLSTASVGSSLTWAGVGVDAVGRYDIDRFDSQYALVAWNNKSGSGNTIESKLIDFSGTTPTEPGSDTIEVYTGGIGQLGVCCESSTVGYVLFYNGNGAVLSGRLSKVTRTGDSISDSVNNCTAGDGYLAIDSPAVDSVIIIYENGSGYPTVNGIDTSAGVSEGTPQVLESAVYDNGVDILALSSSLGVAAFEDSSGLIKVCAFTISGTTLSAGTPLQVVASGGAMNRTPKTLARVDNTTFKLCLYDGSNNVIVTYTISGTTISQSNSTVVNDNGNITVLSDGSTQLAYSDDSDNFLYLQSIAGNARFYQGTGPGEGVLSEKFTLPFSGAEPGAMTLSGTLGTVVIGANSGVTTPIVYANNPYITGTATAQGFPTNAPITSLKWI